MATDMEELGQPNPLTFEYLISRPIRTALGEWTLAEEVVGLNIVQPMIGLDGYAVVCILAGTAVYEHADGRSEQLRPGDVLVLRPGVVDRYGTDEPGATWDELYVVFDGPIFDVLARAGLFDPGADVVRARGAASWTRRLRRLLKDVAADGSRHYAQLVAFVGLLVELLPDRAATVAGTAWVPHATARLSTDLTGPLDLRSVAGELGVHYDTFRRVFRREVGVSPGRYRSDQRIAAAQELLRRRPRLTNRQVAEAFGFSDEFHFSRRFRELTGQTPREFRASIFSMSGHTSAIP